MDEPAKLPSFQRVFGIIVFFFAIAAAIYGWSLWNPFVRWDDGMLIYENPAIRAITPGTIRWIFTHFDPELYIPVTFFTYQVEYFLTGVHPFLYHFDNLLLHTLNALLVAWTLLLLLRRRWIALFCGLLFLVHPLHTEAVLWASARKDVLSTFFFLGAIVAYMYRGEGRKWYYVSIILFLLGLLSKAMIATLPVVLLLFDYAQGRKADRAMWMDKIPYAVLSFVVGLVAVIGKKGVIASSTVSAKILMAFKSTAFYLEKFFWPTDLSVLYPYTKAITITSSDFYVPMIIAFLVLLLGIWLLRRNRVAACGIFFYLLTVAPTLLNFAKGGQLDIYFASDRYVYVPSIGVLIAVGAMMGTNFQDTRCKRQICFLFLVSCLFVLSLRAHAQSLVWTNTRTLFENVLAIYPDSSHVAHNNLGNMYRLDGDNAHAIEEYKKALAIRPHPRTLSNLGAAYRKEKRYSEAIDAYMHALQLDPKDPFAHFGLGIVYGEEGKLTEAQREYKNALAADPTYEEVYVNLGALYADEGDYAQAKAQYEAALVINPYFPDALYNLGIAETHLSDFHAAIVAYERAISLEPRAIGARINVALLYYQTGEQAKAVAQFRAVLAIDPKNRSAMSALQQLGAQ